MSTLALGRSSDLRWTLRAGIASLGALGAAVCMRQWAGDEPAALWIPTGLLVAAAVLVHHRHLGSQLLARAVMWANLILADLGALLGSDHERRVALGLAICTGGALLVLGRRGLDDDARAGRFAPLAFRASLLAVMVMALADAQTLALFGTLQLQGWDAGTGRAALLLGLSAALVLAIVGLYRLRLWGLALTVVSCAAMVAVAASGALGLPTTVNGAFAATGLVQLAIAAPLVAAVIRGGERPRRARLSRASVTAGTLFVIGLLALNLVCTAWGWPAN
jgi:hypothetical protein